MSLLRFAIMANPSGPASELYVSTVSIPIRRAGDGTAILGCRRKAAASLTLERVHLHREIVQQLMLLIGTDRTACQFAIAIAVRLAEESRHPCCRLLHLDTFVRSAHRNVAPSIEGISRDTVIICSPMPGAHKRIVLTFQCKTVAPLCRGLSTIVIMRRKFEPDDVLRPSAF